MAVLDTGVEADLPELRGVVLPGLNAEDGPGDGRQDLDEWGDGHGTAMASAIAGQGQGTGFSGIAPDAKILPVVTQSGPAYAKGIRFAANQGAQVINLSQGIPGHCPTYLQEAIAYALDRDVVILAGAGNDALKGNPSMYPGNCKGVVAVGAVNREFEPWEKTERQPYVDVAAPGVDTTVLMRDGKLYSGSGTSNATAFTSAAVALIRARYPMMTNREIVRQLTASAMDIYKKGKDASTGHGIIRPYRPLARKAPSGTANPVFTEFDQWARDHQREAGHETVARTPKESSISDTAIIIPVAILTCMAGLCVFAYFNSRHKPMQATSPRNLPSTWAHTGATPPPGPLMKRHTQAPPLEIPDRPDRRSNTGPDGPPSA